MLLTERFGLFSFLFPLTYKELKRVDPEVTHLCRDGFLVTSYL